MENKKFKVTQKDKQIIYTIYTEEGKYQGIGINILDFKQPIEDSRYLSFNLALYVDSISTNYNPYETMHLSRINGWKLREPAECYVIDEDINKFHLHNNFLGKYLGNIICNTLDGKKVVCFISQSENKRYYNFLDLTFTDILACTEWDMDFEYLGFCEESKKQAHNEYQRRLKEMKLQLSFTTQIDLNSEEKLIKYNGKSVTKKEKEKYKLFKNNVMDLLNYKYILENNCIEEI